ncbi:MAG: hypothetical protein HYU86_11325 [Chloroflexi bacterium]|nr:hypothetical protein [Chloroflexota bacterium]
MTQVKPQYLVDEKGRKRAVVLSIREYQALLDDLRDMALMAQRRNEPSEPWEEVKQRLEARWLNIE